MGQRYLKGRQINASGIWLDAAYVAVVFDGDDIETDLRGVDVMDAQEMMRAV